MHEVSKRNDNKNNNTPAANIYNPSVNNIYNTPNNANISIANKIAPIDIVIVDE